MARTGPRENRAFRSIQRVVASLPPGGVPPKFDGRSQMGAGEPQSNARKVTELKDWLTILAITFSPFIAVQVSERLSRSRFIRDQKLRVLETMLSTRHDGRSPKRIEALNSIELAFRDDAVVRSRWREYYDLAANQSVTEQQRYRKLLELYSAMANSIGYRGFTEGDFDRSMSPPIAPLPGSPEMGQQDTRPIRPGERRIP